MLWIILSIAAILLLYRIITRPYKYWEERGVKQTNPIPILGDNFIWQLLGRLAVTEAVEIAYNIDKNSRYAGMYMLFNPIFVLRSPDIIRTITVKDFDHFTDHMDFLPHDPLWENNLILLKGEKWRRMRSMVSPVFTSSKMKFMFESMKRTGEQFASYFLKQKSDKISVEFKEIFTHFTNDVIANTVFGIHCDSLENPNDEFYKQVKQTANLNSPMMKFKFMLNIILPGVYRALGLRFFSSEIEDFFQNLVSQNIESRLKCGIRRPDLIQILLDARKGGLKFEESNEQDTGFATVEESDIGKKSVDVKEITDKDIRAQATTFLFAGFESVANLMCFTAYELGVNPDIQEKLKKEVDDAFKACGNNITYEALAGMKYLDMVITESLRKWPFTVATERICNKPYTIPPVSPDERPVHLYKGQLVQIPIYGIHRDPENYPDPERFDPERFSDENKSKIKPYTYLPFGVGPRACIGSRFALLETKVLIFYLLRNFEIVPNEKTQIPLKISKKSLTAMPENGFCLDLKRRTDI